MVSACGGGLEPVNWFSTRILHLTFVVVVVLRLTCELRTITQKVEGSSSCEAFTGDLLSLVVLPLHQVVVSVLEPFSDDRDLSACHTCAHTNTQLKTHVAPSLTGFLHLMTQTFQVFVRCQTPDQPISPDV